MGFWSIGGGGLPADDRFPLQECRIEVGPPPCVCSASSSPSRESHNCQFNTVPSPFSATSNAIPLSRSALFRLTPDTIRDKIVVGYEKCTHGAANGLCRLHARRIPENARDADLQEVPGPCHYGVCTYKYFSPLPGGLVDFLTPSGLPIPHLC